MSVVLTGDHLFDIGENGCLSDKVGTGKVKEANSSSLPICCFFSTRNIKVIKRFIIIAH